MQLERRLKPSLGRPDKASDMEDLNEVESKMHDSALETMHNFKKTSSEAQQTIFKEFCQELCESTKTLLSLMDNVTSAKNIKEDPSAPKPRPKMEDLVRQNVIENISDVTGDCPSGHSVNKYHKQEVVVTKTPNGDATIHTPRRANDGAHTTSTKKRKQSGTKQPTQSADKRVVGSAYQSTFKNNLFHWNRLPLDTMCSLLVGSGPASQPSPSINLRESSKEEIIVPSALSPSISESLDIFNEPLKTKKSTELHEIVIACRDKEFEVRFRFS